MDTIPTPLKLDISAPSKDFGKHLSGGAKQRILFSGPFGTGKTYFLKEYFGQDMYSALHLRPVNYSVAHNQDIFELIKFDLLFELLKLDVQFEKQEFQKLLTLQFYVQNHSHDLIKLIVEQTTKIGKNVVDIADKLLALYEKYSEYHKAAQIDERQKVVDYLKAVKKQQGGIHEEDAFTQLIGNLVEQLKQKEKQTVLVIDDLDRIDPEHIFRLLNVFAAHFDIDGEENKFGFDKIVFVCDIHNVRNIFHTRYGANVDFSGYIDKFYTSEIFHFDNSKIIEGTIAKLLLSIKLDKAGDNCFPINNQYDTVHKDLTYILSAMVKTKAVNLRSLIKLADREYPVNNYEAPLGLGDYPKQSFEYLLWKNFDFLCFVLGDGEALKKPYKNAQKVI